MRLLHVVNACAIVYCLNTKHFFVHIFGRHYIKAECRNNFFKNLQNKEFNNVLYLNI